jgi:uncharacterized repeat protein (TIGR01451 family)
MSTKRLEGNHLELRFVPVLTLILSMFVAGFSGRPQSAAEDPDDPIPTNPFEAPSAAYEAYQLRQAGLMEGPPPAEQPSEEPSPPLRLLALAGGDILANDPTDDTAENTTQSETTLAVLGDTLIAGYNNSGPGGFSGLSRSTDLGANWTDLGGIGQSGDPVLAVHQASGTAYYAELATFAGDGGDPGIGVAISTNEGQTFPTLVNASPVATTLTGSQDKPWIAVDNTGGARDGDIYVCWTRFFSSTSELRFSRSIDGGNTYQDEQPLAPSGTAPFGCSVAVGPAGEVYVAWADRTGATQGDIRFRRSLDGGVNFDPVLSISTGNRHPGTDTIVACDLNRPTLTGNIRMLHQAWIAVDTTGGPFNGNIYVVWASDPIGVPDNSDVFFSRSLDGGAMWTPPVQLGAGGGATDQFEPFAAVGGAGAVSIAWYDRRDDPANNFNIDVYKVFSEDGGAGFGGLIQVTDTSFPVPQINPNFDSNVVRCYMGEYIAIAADTHNFYYLWGDNRNTLVTANWPGGRPDPDVWFDSQPAPVVNDADLRIEKSDLPDPVAAGALLTYTLTAFNDGPHVALDVVVTDTLPTGVTYVSDTGGCDTSALPVLTCNVGTLVNGANSSFDIVVLVDANLAANGISLITNNASVTGVANDLDPSDNSVSEDTQIVAQADLAIVSFEAVDPPAAIFLSDPVQVNLRKVITNLGPSSPMDATLTMTATAGPDATVDPGLRVVDEAALALNEQREVLETFTITCTESGTHTFHFENTIAPTNPADTDPNPANDQAATEIEVECVEVTINIKPGSDPNSINLRAGSIPVAVLTTAVGEYGMALAFDATLIDPLSVRFSPRNELLFGTEGALEIHNRGHLEDAFELDEVTQDGDLDMVLHFKASESGLAVGDIEACVIGSWTDLGGVVHSFFGCDAIRIVP